MFPPSLLSKHHYIVITPYSSTLLLLLLVVPRRCGRQLLAIVLDATYSDTCTFTPSQLPRPTSEAGAVTALAERSKYEKYSCGPQSMPHLHTCGYGDGRPLRTRNSLLPERTRLSPQVDDWPWRSQIFQLPAAKSIQSCTSLFPVCVCITLCHWEL